MYMRLVLLAAVAGAAAAYRGTTGSWLQHPRQLGRRLRRGGLHKQSWSRGPLFAAENSGDAPEGGEEQAAREGGGDGENENRYEVDPTLVSGEPIEMPRDVDLRAFRARLVAMGVEGYGSDAKVPGSLTPLPEEVRGETESKSKWAHELKTPEQGCLLLANENLFLEQQPYFYRAVIYIIEHSDQGSAGLILNQPTNFTMGEMTEKGAGLQSLPGMEDVRLYLGGDVGGRREDGLDVVNLMHGHELPGHEVVRGVRLGGLREALAKVGEGRASPQDFKFFSKYAGWGPGQLEAEVEAKSWYVAACDVGTVLEQHLEEDQPDRLWREILIRMGGPFEDIAQNAAQQRSSQ